MSPKHVAIIMDGNGRWATQRGRSRTAGHVAGAHAVSRIVEHARRRQIPFLTLYAFSSDNWQRPARETSALMSLFGRYIASEAPRCIAHGIRLSVIGRRDRLPVGLQREIASAELATQSGTAMRLRLAVDYSARDVIMRAARDAGGTASTRDAFARAMALASHDVGDVPDVDVLIRTGGEQRLSDFLLWECAYAELVFARHYWPDFTGQDLDDCLADFGSRQRRFGRVDAMATPA